MGVRRAFVECGVKVSNHHTKGDGECFVMEFEYTELKPGWWVKESRGVNRHYNNNRVGGAAVVTWEGWQTCSACPRLVC